jgi:hypothetical protein
MVDPGEAALAVEDLAEVEVLVAVEPGDDKFSLFFVSVGIYRTIKQGSDGGHIRYKPAQTI